PGVETFATAVADPAARLEQDQAAVRVGDVDAAAGGVTGQGEVVALGGVTEQRQPQAATPLERTVTGAGAAAELAQQRRDVPLEIDARQLPAVGQLHRLGNGSGGQQQ